MSAKTPPPEATASDAAETARQGLNTVAALITEARLAIGSGAAVRLAPLQEQTRAACAAVRTLDEKDAQILRSDLEAVLFDLDALATDLAGRYGDLARRTESAAADGRRLPTVAAVYKTTEPPRGGRSE